MEKLNPQDLGFLKLESARCPFHVAGLMILKMPEDAPRTYVRRMVDQCGRLHELWPVFNRKLKDPEDLSDAAWVTADDFVPERHVFHYALPRPGRMEDLMRLVTRAHERPLDRSRPLWELHMVEGLPRNRLAIYCKVHHALVDGVGAMRMLQGMFSDSPGGRIDFNASQSEIARHEHHSLFQRIGDLGQGLLKQYRAIPELSRLLAHMGSDALRGKTDAMRLPFTAPRTLFNTELDSRRSIVTCDLPLGQVKTIAHRMGGTVNDVLLSICGGALRQYLLAHQGLPRGSLVAGMPVSLKTSDSREGNKLSYIMCPFFTNEADALKRLQRIVGVTSSAKRELNSVSSTAAQDYYALIMAPTLLLTVTGNATKVRPAINAIFSNVPGSRERLYLDGSELEAIYPLSIVTDAMGLNITVVSHVNKLCFAIASCPRDQPGIEDLGKLLKDSYRELRDAVRVL
jgi:WS/DGAT/MGAT family acyltransferase